MILCEYPISQQVFHLMVLASVSDHRLSVSLEISSTFIICLKKIEVRSNRYSAYQSSQTVLVLSKFATLIEDLKVFGSFKTSDCP